MKSSVYCLIIIILISTTVYGSDYDVRKIEYDASKNHIEKILNVLPPLSQEELKHGKFVVNTYMNYYQVNYMIKNNNYSIKLNRRGVNALNNFGEVAAIDINGYSTLFVTVPGKKFLYIVYPSSKEKGFISKLIGLEDDKGTTGKVIELGKPKKKRLVLLKNELEEEFTNKYGITCVNPLIIGISPMTEEIIYMNDQYPDYIRPFVDECKKLVHKLLGVNPKTWKETQAINGLRGIIYFAEDLVNNAHDVRASRPTPPPPPPPPPRQ